MKQYIKYPKEKNPHSCDPAVLQFIFYIPI